ncbi:MAG: hypothetical protein ACFCAD_20220 [Pleurocapsa sp.]
MPNKLLVQKIWLIIEELEEEVLNLSDSELIYRMQSKIATEAVLEREEISFISEYVQCRIPLIRDLVEIRSIKLGKSIH